MSMPTGPEVAETQDLHLNPKQNGVLANSGTSPALVQNGKGQPNREINDASPHSTLVEEDPTAISEDAKPKGLAFALIIRESYDFTLSRPRAKFTKSHLILLQSDYTSLLSCSVLISQS